MDSKALEANCVITNQAFKCCTYSSKQQKVIVGCKASRIELYESRTGVESLMDICRKELNKHVAREKFTNFQLPRELEKYLRYDDLKRTSNSNSPNTIAKNAANNLNLNQNSNNYATTFYLNQGSFNRSSEVTY